jgi:uncharacterized protein
VGREAAATFEQSAFDSWRIELGGIELTADRAGVLVIESIRTLIVSDLHLEKGTSLARRRALLPPYDTRSTLRRLMLAMERLRPKVVIALGDSFHDGQGAERLCDEDRASLAALQKGREWIWIAGNHDPELPPDLGGERAGDWRCRGVSFRHEPLPAGNEVVGHLHPCARVSRGGHSQRRPCFAFGSGRLILPAFGAYTGGLNVLDPAIAGLFGGAPAIAVLGRSGVYPVAARQLRPD